MYREKAHYAREKMEKIYDTYENKDSIKYWHYTSMNAILSIFKSFIDSSDEKITTINLYASHNRFLNDSQEYEDGKKCLSDFIEEHNKDGKKEEINTEASTDANVYIVSFCSDGDLLSQWKWYGGESGISFCFNASKAVYSIYTEKDENDKEVGPVVKDSFTKPLPVFYDYHGKKDYFDKLITKILINKFGSLDVSNIDLLPELFIPFCKNEYFHEEKEHRLVFFDYDDLTCVEGHKTSFNNKYNISSKGVLKPALDVKVTLDKKGENYADDSTDELNNSTSDQTENECLISQMIVGPGVNQHLYFNGLIHIFDRNYFRFQPDSKIPEELNINDVYEETDDLPIGKLIYIKDKQYRDDLPTIDYPHLKTAYKCHNGLLIMKSSIPFRG